MSKTIEGDTHSRAILRQQQQDRLRTELHNLIDAHADDPSLLRHFACDCAERAMRAAKWSHPASWEALKVARKYAEGEADSLLLFIAWGRAPGFPFAALSAKKACLPSGRGCRTSAASARGAFVFGNFKELKWQLAHLKQMIHEKHERRTQLLDLLLRRKSQAEAAPAYGAMLEEGLFT